MSTSPYPASIAPAEIRQEDALQSSGVSWAAILAGAAAAAALSFILFILGMGLGLSTVSPYSYNAAPIGTTTIVWLAFTQLAAAGIGGYLAGRLRVKWAGIHQDEAHFRDTAHGLLAWAVATLATVAMLAGSVSTALGGALNAGTAAVGAMATTRQATNAAAYFADTLLRSSSGEGATEAQRTEVGRIITTNLAAPRLAADDRTYLAQLVAAHSGLSQPDAERRVDEIYARASTTAADAKSQAMQAAETARKAAAHSALWFFVALLLGAFIASLMATLGGRARDHDRVVLRSPQ